MKIKLDFRNFSLNADLFDTEISKKFYERLPLTVNELTRWGNELYGSIGIDLGEEKPVHLISEGGLAYTNRGNYLCLFFGQKPAWAVEYIGKIQGDEWQKLIKADTDSLTITQA
ncbi:hypothetical protein KA977_02885 [Candidatus Dependentiae bacterium]|nr:hypothetical protein [Candidatus Dependentiae bacterium]